MTVGLAHPDALAAVLNPQGEINTHFATSPFHEAEMKAGLRTITSAYKIMGGPTTNLVFVTTDKFRTDFKPESKEVFVYGREVNDFRAVDYEVSDNVRHSPNGGYYER